MTRAIETLHLSQLLPRIRDCFRQIPDHRGPEESGFAFDLQDVLMAGLAMMFVQDPSLSEFQARLQNRQRGNNLRTIFGVDAIPKDSQFRRILDPLDPNLVQAAFDVVLKPLQRSRLWTGYRVLGGRYAVLFDGFEFFRSQKKGCQNCLEFHHRDGRVDYAHQVLAATLAHPTAKRPIPLLLESITREDGAEKQDCEFNAARRLIPKLAKQHPHMDLVFVGDGLFSKVPMIDLITSCRSSYILVAKPKDHVTLGEGISGLRLAGGVEEWEHVCEKKRHLYEWATDVELTASSGLKVHWFSYKEMNSQGKIVYQNTWVTDIKPTRKNVQELVEVGRHRWQIENQAFDVLKNHGYHLEHNYGHGEKNLAFIFIILNFLAYMLHQVIALADPIFRSACEWVGSEYKLWNDIRVLLKHFVWGSWQALLEHILEYREDTGWESG